MSLLHRLVVSTACPSTHHRLAMDALLVLRCPEADGWRELFLNYYELYLKGAKAPDDEFKDFRNHVYHVRDNGWGGAAPTAQLWYERLVIALRKQYWSDAVYTAGVLSHYLTDPLMPLHTGQTEEEGRIHRAVEWSVTKSYDELREILIKDLGGYPVVRLPDGPGWLKQLIRDNAALANSYYETVLDHYNLAKGVEDPPSGLDQELKDCFAGLLGQATMTIAKVLERALGECATAPPMCELVTETIMAVAKTPWRWILQEMAEDDEKELLEAILEECQTTGKVIDSLPDDDALIRKLHAEQVLRTTLAQLDDQPVRPTGLRHGQGEVEREREEGFWESLWGAEPSAPVFSDQPLEPADDEAGGYVGAGSRRGTVGGLSASYSTGYGGGSSYSSSRGASLSAGAASRVPLVSRYHGGSSTGDSLTGRSSGNSGGGASGGASRNEPPLTRLGGGRASSRPARPSMLRRRLRTLDDERQDDDANDDDSSDSPDSLDTTDSSSRAGRRRDGGQRRRFDGAAVAAGAAAGLAAAGLAAASSVEDESGRADDDRRDEGGEEQSDEPPKLTRRARLAGMFRGMASKVMEKAAATAGKVRGLVRRRPKPPADDAADASADADGNSTTTSSNRQRLVDDGESSGPTGADERGGRGANNERSSGAKSSGSSAPETQDADSRERGGRSRRFNLELDQAVEAAPSIGPKMAKRLENQGVGTVAQLIEADAEQVAARLGIRSIDAEMIRTWQRQAELMCRVPELRGHDAQVLVACGVVDAAELAGMDPASLFELIEPFLGTREADQILRGSPKPDLDEVADWIEWAQSRRDLS